MHQRISSLSEPIAVVGIGCRFPGEANDPTSFWKLMTAGSDAISEIPTDRWSIPGFYDAEQGKPGKTYAKWGGFISGIDRFDPVPFGISAREMNSMDPQQRLMLEVSWRAMEDAGMPVLTAKPRNVGVYVGIAGIDFPLLQNRSIEFRESDPYAATGTTLSIAANRISYTFNFTGPSFITDTACSSALTALNLACRAIWNGDCEVAIAGGVNAILLPLPYIAFCTINMLSPEGRCKAFDASANGFVRGEGAGAVVLKSLSAAQRDGDRIYAVVRGTGINQDGHTSGMTVPSQTSQEELVRQVCFQSGIDPATLQYMEAHGTGTSVGDPIEARALGTVIGAGRPANAPCLLGSVKTNIGHLEAASGIAGFIKAALTLHHGLIPPNLHFNNPNPNIDFEALRMRVVTGLEPYGPGRRLAGINSFGFGGANAFALLEDVAGVLGHEPSKPVHFSASFNGTETESEPAPAQVLFVSAKTEAALHAAAANWATFLRESKESLNDICYSADARRTLLDERIAVLGSTAEEMATQLAAFAAKEDVSTLVHGKKATDSRIVFVFSGQGPQWWAMGRELWKHEPVFRQKIEECHEALLEAGGWSLKDELLCPEEKSRMSETEIAQPAITAVQIALAALWKSWGIVPTAVVGHSVGEVAAAHAAGALSLRDAMRVIYHRGRCMEHAPERGKMIAVGLTAEQALQRIAPYGEKLSLAAANGPSSVSISGDAAAVEELGAKIDAEGIFMRFVPVNYAFHSAHMDPVRTELLSALEGLAPTEAQIPIYSTVTGLIATGTDFNADYWWQNVRQTVNFGPAIGQIATAGYEIFVEVAAHPVLSNSVKECLSAAGKSGTVVPSLRRKTVERTTMLTSLATLGTLGLEVDWAAVFPDASFVSIPGYAWQKEVFWTEPALAREWRLSSPEHPLLGMRHRSPEMAWEAALDRRSMAWLNDHRVQSHMVFPAAGYLELGLATARDLHGPGAVQIEDIEFSKALFIPVGAEPPLLRIGHETADNSFRVHSRSGGVANPWSIHATGKHRQLIGREPAVFESIEAIRARCTSLTTHDEFYEYVRALGLHFGPSFQGVKQVWWGDDEAIGEVVIPDQIANEAHKYEFHPAQLDACLQVSACAMLSRFGKEEKKLMLPVFLERVRLFQKPTSRLWVNVKVTRPGSHSVSFDILVADESGTLVAELRGMQVQAVEGMRSSATDTLDELCYEQEWRLAPLPLQGRKASSPKAFLPDTHAMGAHLQKISDNLDLELGLRARFREVDPDFNILCGNYVRRAFERLGWTPEPGERFTSTELQERLGIISRYVHMLPRMLTMCLEDGYLRLTETPGTWEVIRPLRDGAFAPGEFSTWPQIESLWKSSLERFPALLPELTLLERSGRELAEIFRGEKDPIQLMIPNGSTNMLEQLYSDSFFCRIHNVLAREALADAVSRLPEGRVLRILEIGAGTGGLTGFVLPIFPPAQTEYVYTDISRAFFNRSEQRFRDYPFVKYEVLNIENDPAGQGFAPHSFDVVLASNVMHATVDLRQTLRHARQLLAKDGLLIVLEVEVSLRQVDLTFGLSEGWWRFQDFDLRPDYPTVTREKWQAILGETGYADVAVMTDTPDRNEPQQITLLARAEGEEEESFIAPESEPPAEEIGTCLIFEDKSGIMRALGQKLAARGSSCVFVKPGAKFERLGDGEFTVNPSQLQDMKQLLAELTGPLVPQTVVHAWSFDVAPGFPSASEVIEAETLTCHSTLHLVQALTRHTFTASPKLWLLTRATQPIGGVSMNLAQSPLIGLGRTIVNEYPSFSCCLIDLGSGDPDIELDTLIQEFSAKGVEGEIALRGEARYVPRLAQRVDRLDRVPRAVVSVNEVPCRLDVPRAGAIDNLAFSKLTRRPPGPGEVEIEVHAAGLNFRDVMKALGIYPADAGDALFLGDECSGKIAAVGEGVEHLKVGDPVMAIGTGCFASHVTTAAVFALPKPDHITFEEASTMLSTHMTAYYALRTLGHMKKGEKVLIHAAAGGVGLAAVQLALVTGAEVFATAGSDEKRTMLRSIGVHHVMDSRSLAFADEILDITKGKGVDLVLNSIAGEAIAKSLSVLGSGGRFLEIGKRDIYGNTRIGLRPFKNNLSYFAIDLSKIMDPEFIGSFFGQLLELFASQKLRPLPYRSFPMGDAVEAFRYMTQARQIGKVVLAIYGARVPLQAVQPTAPAPFDPAATYLVTGGAGGFGLTVAQWIVEQGARHVVLASRSASPGPDALPIISAMKAAGAEVIHARCDVGREEDLARVLGTIASSGHPLKGVVHSAMVLDDSILDQLTPERFRKVTAPKVDGAANLHRLTRDLPLDYFILFSSSSATFGNPGQANYCAANTFLDALAHERRRLGLPALAVNWGLLAEVGIITRDAGLAEYFRRFGFEGLPTQVALDTLGALLAGGAIQDTVWNVDWGKWVNSGMSVAKSIRFELLTSSLALKKSERNEGQQLRAALAGGKAEDRPPIVQAYLRRQLGEVLRVPPAKIELERPLNEQGMDSLMAVELLHRIESDLGVSIPPAKLMGKPTVVKMGETLLDAMGMPVEASASAASSSASSATAEVKLETLIHLPEPFPSGAEPFSPGRLAHLEHVLVTGPFDLLGIHIVADLLEKTSAQIHFLTDDPETGRLRLLQALHEHGFAAADDSRLDPLAGDLSLPRLGLSESRFAEIAGVVEVIFHNAAYVHHTAPYDELKKINVDGTIEVIRLAAQTRIKPIHYLSSIAIFPACLTDTNKIVLENDPLEASERLIGGYAQSRWVAEKCLRLAETHGVPVTVYRNGPMIGNIHGKVSTTNDFTWRMLRTCLDIGSGPAGQFDLYVTPVNFVSGAMVHCALQPTSAGQTYHVMYTKAFTLTEMLNCANANGHPVKIVPWAEWQTDLSEKSSQKDLMHLLPYFMFLPGEEFDNLGSSGGTGRIDSSALQHALEGSDIVRPAMADLMPAYLDDLVRSGYLKPSVHPNSPKASTGDRSEMGSGSNETDMALAQ